MTQEYTPVPWQDETTSQQGTLINAERLNQMQTAHHFADGLEEVDAIPTADPGVSYHKIVYCTADSTIYRWDGTEWTKDIDDETKALLQQEIARATAAEGELAQSIEDETTARETADTAMQADISALQSGKLGKKTTSSNQTQVYAVKGSAQRMITAGYSPDAIPLYNIEQTLFSKMPTLWDPIDDTVINYGWATAQIGAEATARADADTALGGRIDTEQARAEAAEQANAQAIANTYTKAEIDTALGAKADVATTYTKAEVQTYVSNALDGYAPMVRTTGNQTIAGTKTLEDAKIYTREPLISTSNTANTWHLMLKVPTDNTRFFNLVAVKPYSLNRTEIWLRTGSTAGIVLFNNYVMNQDTICIKQDTSYVYLYIKTLEAYQPIRLFSQESTSNIPASYIGDGSTYASLDDAPGTTVINATVSTPEGLALDANVVHRSGAEVITGSKTFYDASLGCINICGGRTSGPMGVLRFRNYQDVLVSGLYAEVDGTTVIDLLGTTKAFKVNNQRAYSAGNTTDVATIGTLDAYTPMVRTTGNQTIQGIKAFNSYIGRINPAYITDIQADTYKYYSLDSLSTAIGATGPLIHYYATGGGNQATKAHKNVGWDLKGKGSNGKIYNGRFVITLDPDNEQVFLGLRIQNETDGTTKSSTIATLNLTS